MKRPDPEQIVTGVVAAMVLLALFILLFQAASAPHSG